MSYYQKKHHEKKDSNRWIRKHLQFLLGDRVVIFSKGGIHSEGTVQRVQKEFVELVASATEPVEVESNANGRTLENFLKFYLRIEDIVGFGQETLGD